MRWLPSIVLLLFISISACGQLLPFKNYTEKDGLNSKIVYSVVRDNRGLLWVGTPFGVNWFDGTHFFQPDLPAKVSQLYVQRFYKDKEGIVWTLTFFNGFYKFQNNRFTQYLIDPAYKENTKNNIMDMAEMDSSHYIIATDDGAYLFNGKTFEPIDQKNLVGQIESVVVSKKYVLAGYGRGLYCYNYHRQWKRTAISLKNIAVNRIFIKDDHVWAATEKGLYYFDHFSFEHTNEPTAVYLKNKAVLDVTENASGEVWLSGNDIVYKLNRNELIPYSKASGLTATALQIYFDQQNTGWFPTYEGLFKLNAEYYSFQKINSNVVNSFAKANEKVWISYPGGISEINGAFNYHFPKSQKAFYTFLFYANKSKQLWITNESGVYVLKGKDLQKKFSFSCSALYEDDDGVLWMATDDNKLFILKNDQLQPVQFPFHPDDFITTIFKDNNGILWLGFRTGGVLKCRIDNTVLRTVKEYSSRTGFSDIRIRSCHADGKGNILFGTRTNGLFIFSLNSNRLWHINNNSGLDAAWVISIDNDDSLAYLATNKGLYLLKTQTDYSHPQITPVNFTSDEISSQVDYVLVDEKKVWVGSNGLIQFFPQKLKKDTMPPPVYITQVSVQGKADSSWLPYSVQQNTLHLSYNRNVIAFEFAGIHLKDEDELHYHYKLEGQDKDWSAVTNRNFVSYNLPPGRYRFLVQAENANGTWSNHSASYSFIIAQPFWTTWWFMAFILSSVMILAYFIYRYRLQQAVKLERLRYKISTDLHDDIGSTLSSISILSEMALTEHNHQQSEAMVSEIKENSLDLMEKMDDIVWSINPKNDSLGSLLLRIKRFSSKLFEAKDIDYSIDIDKSVAEIKLPMEYRQHIYLILKEAINNLVKYSGATKAAIEVNFENAYLKIRISDNGKGFDLNSANSGNGIVSMKSRAAIMKANLKIETSKGEGTTLRVQVKIK